MGDVIVEAQRYFRSNEKVLTEVFPGIQTGNCGLGFEAALSLGTSVPFHYMTYIIRTCPIVEGQLLAFR